MSKMLYCVFEKDDELFNNNTLGHKNLLYIVNEIDLTAK